MSDSFSALSSRSLPVRVQDLALDSSTSTREQFLRLHLVPEMIALLPLQQMTEVLTIPLGQIVPVPHLPAWVMGVYNWRGEILWMIDLAHLCGLTPWYEQSGGISAHKAVVLNVRDPQAPFTQGKGHMIGLVVNQVEDIEWCDPTSIQSLPVSTVTPDLGRFLRGYWWKSDDAMLAVLDGEAIIRAMPKP